MEIIGGIVSRTAFQQKLTFGISFETHPMSRPFDNTTYELKIKGLYENTQPQGDDLTYSWRTQDFVNAIISAGFNIKEMQEFHSLREDLEAHNYLYIRDEHKSKFKKYRWSF